MVVCDGKRHVFSQFGSGTLRKAPTFWSRNCTFYPPGLVREHDALINHGVNPILYVDGMAMVTTYWDIFYNQILEKRRNRNKHGSVGVGFGTTIERNQNSPYRLNVQDLAHPKVLEMKLDAIESYYTNCTMGVERTGFHIDKAREDFIKACEECLKLITIVQEKNFFADKKFDFDNIIFEGSQGILLDMDFGFFPHVTRGNTTSKNAIELIERNNLPKPEIYYVTRAYQTRHGRGPMTNEDSPLLKLKDNPTETNVTNDWQEHFRKGYLDLDMMRYALACDDNFSSGLTKYMTITCVDQIVGDIIVTDGGKPISIATDFVDKIGHILGFGEVFISKSDRSENIIKSTYGIKEID